MARKSATTVQTRTPGNKNIYDHHAKNCFSASCIVIEEALVQAGCPGDYFIVPREKAKWKPRNNEKMCLRPSQGRDIRIRCKPGDSGTVWEYSLVCPNDIEVEAVRSRLEKYLGPEETDLNHEQPAPVDTNAAVEDTRGLLHSIMTALDRRKQRQVKILQIKQYIESLNQQLDSLAQQAAKLKIEIQEEELSIGIIEEEDAKDDAANKAEQLATLIQSIA